MAILLYVAVFVAELDPVYVGVPVLCVKKWIDYTNRYGFGCLFSDGSVSVSFLDGSRMTRRYANTTVRQQLASYCTLGENMPTCWLFSRPNVTSQFADGRIREQGPLFLTGKWV